MNINNEDFTKENIQLIIEEVVIFENFSPEFILEENMDDEQDVGLSLVSEPNLLNTISLISKTPKLIFIIPYRDREQQQVFFSNHMKTVLSDMNPDDYKIYFSEQCDTRDFNRGAMKNIGFFAMKQKYPDHYKTITFVFNDIDTMPFTKNFFDYTTVPGVVKHFYGYNFTLGGIVSITGGDFEHISGFPNLWTWGFEDNMLQNRVLAANIKIDRSQFYPIMDKNIVHLNDGVLRSVNRTEFDRYLNKTSDGLKTITNLNYTIDEERGFIQITDFSCETENNSGKNIQYDLRNGNIPFKTANNTNKRRGKMGMIM